VVILDTSIIIDHLRNKTNKPSILMNIAKKYHTKDLGISVISIQELYEGRSTREEKKKTFYY